MSGSVDVNDILNTAIALRTSSTNKKVLGAQQRAISEGIYTLPYLPKAYQRVGTALPDIGSKLVSEMRAKAGRLAPSTSDIDKAFAAQFTGEKQAGEIGYKYNLAGQDEINEQKAQQIASDYKVDVANVETLAKNRALNADAIKKLYLTGANYDLAENTNFNNYLMALSRNVPVKQYKANLGEMYKAYNDSRYAKIRDEYSSLSSSEEESKRREAYNESIKDLKKSGIS